MCLRSGARLKDHEERGAGGGRRLAASAGASRQIEIASTRIELRAPLPCFGEHLRRHLPHRTIVHPALQRAAEAQDAQSQAARGRRCFKDAERAPATGRRLTLAVATIEFGCTMIMPARCRTNEAESCVCRPRRPAKVPLGRSQTDLHRSTTYTRPPNAITLSCKSRLPCRPLESGAAAAATNAQWQERTAADVTRACSSEPPKAAPPPSQGSAVFVSL